MGKNSRKGPKRVLDFKGKSPSGYKQSHSQPELTEGWKKAYELGIAGQLCDRIVKEREIPDRLVDALVAAFDHDETLVTRDIRRSELRKQHKAA